MQVHTEGHGTREWRFNNQIREAVKVLIDGGTVLVAAGSEERATRYMDGVRAILTQFYDTGKTSEMMGRIESAKPANSLLGNPKVNPRVWLDDEHGWME